MKKLKLSIAALAFLGGVNSVNAQTDVTSTYLTNAGFDVTSDFITANKATSSNSNVSNWTKAGNQANSCGAAVAYESAYTLNGKTIIGVDKFGNNSGGALGISTGWGQSVTYTQAVTLPAGEYKITFDIINVNGSTGVNTPKFGWEPSGGSAVYTTRKTYEQNIWYTDAITFTLDAETAGNISVGGVMGDKTSTSCAIIFVDNVKIFKMDEESAPTIANPIDYSDLIDQKTWSVQQDDNDTPTTSSALVTNITSGDWTGRYTERYRGVAGHYGKALFQTVSVPAGVYQVQAACMSSSANGVDAAAGKGDGDEDVAYFYANSEELTYPLSDKKGYYRKHIVTLDADGTIEFGINTKVVGANWNAIGCATVVKVANDYDSYIEDLLSESIAAWNTAHTNLAALDATLLPDAAESAITTELAKARPNTQEAIVSATASLQALIDSYDGIKAAYDEYKSLKATVEDLKNDSKYTFTGADALSTFNSTLSTIDGNAEAATDAATLTALLPSLKTAGNTFVGAIESNDGFDLTYNIENNSFETAALSPWTTNGSNDTGVKPNSNGTYTTTGVDGSYLFNTWNNGTGSKVSQTLSSLPEGYYTVTALVASDAGNTINILAGASTKGIAADATDGKGKFVEGTTDKVLVSDGSLEIGTNSSTWYKSDYFRLTYYTVKAGAAEAWTAAKTAAEAARDDAAYTNVTGSERTNLLAEIAKAEPTTAEAYGTATTALQEKTTAFIEAKDSYDGLVTMRTTGGAYTTVAWPRASEAKATALANAIAANPTDAADAVTKTNAIVTAYRQFVESNGLAEGVAVAINKTSELLVYDADVSTSGWTSGSIGTNNGEKYTKGDGTQPDKYFDGGWSNSAGVNITLTQELTLPAGQYQLQVTARGAENLTSYTMSVGETSVDLPTDGSTGGTFGNGWSDKFLTFESTGSALTLTIAATSTEYYQWISFNRLRLVMLDATLADATDYSNLNTAIAAVEANLGFEDGEYAPYNNVTALGKLAEAKAINQSANNEQSVVQSLTTYLNNASNWTANDGDVDAVYNGNFAIGQGSAAADIQQYGWTRTNGWGQFQNGAEGDNENGTVYYNQTGSLQYGNAGVYTMPLKAETVYELSFKYGAWDKNVTPTVSVLNAEDGMAAMSFAATSTSYKTSMNSVDMVFVTGAEGNYILTIAGNNNLVVTGVSITKAASQVLEFADGTVPNYAPGTYPQVKITRSMAADRWYTAIYPFTVSGVDKIATLDSYSDQNLKFVTSDASTANEPFLMRSASAMSNITLNNVVVAAADAVDVTYGDASLIGTYTQVTKQNDNEISDKYYVISENNIHPVSTSSTATINPYRAYIKLANQSTGAARSLGFFVDEESTAIEGISAETANNDKFYNLNGQRVAAPAKGLYIVNGKKVVVK